MRTLPRRRAPLARASGPPREKGVTFGSGATRANTYSGFRQEVTSIHHQDSGTGTLVRMREPQLETLRRHSGRRGRLRAPPFSALTREAGGR